MRKTSLGHGTIFITVASFIFIVSGYLINILLGRILGPASYGIYGIIISLMTIVNLMQTTGLPQAVSRYVAADEENADGILKSGLFVQIVSTCIASLLFFLLAQPIAQLLNDTSLIPYLQLSAFVFPLYSIYSLYLNYYNGLHYFKKQAIVSSMYAIAKLIIVILLVPFFHVYGAIVGFIAAPLIALLYGVHIPNKTMRYFSYKKLLFFSIPLIGVAICSNLLQSIDLFFVKTLLHSNLKTGFYTANQNIAEMPFYGVAALASVIFPSLSRHISHASHTEAKKLIIKSLRITLLITLPSVLLISATSQSILQFLYSSSYKPGAESLAILAIGNGFFTLFIFLATIISASGSPNRSALFAFLGVIIASILCIFLIPSLGITGAALATTTSACLTMIVALISVYHSFGNVFIFKSTIKIVIASLFIYGVAKLFVIPSVLLLLLYFIFFCFYVFILYILKEITKEDMLMFISLFPIVKIKTNE